MTQNPATRKPDWKTLLSTALFLVLIGLLAAYVHAHWAEMSGLTSLAPATVAALLGLGLFSALVNSLYHLSILRTYGLRLSLTDWLGVVCVSNAIAYVLPMRADLVFSAAYYKRVKGLAYVKSVSMLAGNIVFGVAFSLLQIIVALLCMGLIDGAWPPILWALAGAGTAGLLFFLWLSLKAESGLRARLARHKLIGEVIAGFNALLRNRTLLWQLLLCLVASNLGKLLANMVCFRAVGVPVTLYEALFYSSVGWLSSIVAIVPGNIGLKEGVMGVATRMLGSVFSQGVAASLLDRATIMIVYIALGLGFAFPVWRRFRRGQQGSGKGGAETAAATAGEVAGEALAAPDASARNHIGNDYTGAPADAACAALHSLPETQPATTPDTGNAEASAARAE